MRWSKQYIHLTIFGAEQNEYPLQQSEYKKRCVVIRREYGLQANNHLN